MKKNTKNGSRLVYSTEHGRTCPSCARAVADCECRREKTVPSGDGIVRVSLEKKGRKGKGVTLVSGLLLPAEEIKSVAQMLRKKCSSGGSIKNGIIEIQGDQRQVILEELKKNGFMVKQSGG